MPGIKVTDIAFGRLQSPDLDKQEEFLLNFGMVRVDRTRNALYMRGTDPAHHIHATHLGEPKFIGLAYYAANEEDLERISKVEGASKVEAIDEPGGGKRVRLKEPNGFQIEIVHGIQTLPTLPVRKNTVNWGLERTRRKGDVTRLPKGPSQVKRLGHAVLMSPKFKQTVEWFRSTLGFVCSDDVYAGAKDNVIATFNRVDQGEKYVDHHVFLCLPGPKTGLNHMAFEVQDIDDVVMGHEHIKSLGKYKHMWGLGRHVLGSQVFDYWCDPWGRVHEHWTDSDLYNNRNKPNLVPVEEGLTSQWGPGAPQEFIEHATP